MSAHKHAHPPSEVEIKVKALESLLIEKGLVDPRALDELIDVYEHRVGPQNGAKVVARAWTDADYRERLLNNATEAIRELGFQGRQGEDMIALENSPKVHNMVVCTLCSCYPWPVLGLPPVWYKSALIEQEQYLNRGAFWKSSESIWTMMLKLGSGIVPLNYAIWLFPCDLPSPKI